MSIGRINKGAVDYTENAQPSAREQAAMRAAEDVTVPPVVVTVEKTEYDGMKVRLARLSSLEAHRDEYEKIVHEVGVWFDGFIAGTGGYLTSAAVPNRDRIAHLLEALREADPSQEIPF